MELIEESGYCEFPPRLPEQLIFYPVLNEQYAMEIAPKWNVRYNDDHKGYVTKFEVHCVGGGYHKELWIPAERLKEFNEPIIWENICYK